MLDSSVSQCSVGTPLKLKNNSENPELKDGTKKPDAAHPGQMGPSAGIQKIIDEVTKKEEKWTKEQVSDTS